MATSCLQGETGQLGPDSGFGFCARAGRELALGNGPPGTGEEHWVRCSTEPFKNRSLQVERIGPGSSQALPNPRAACPSGAKGPHAELPTAAQFAPPFQPGRRAVFSPQRFRSCGGDTSAMGAYAEGMCELCAAALQRTRRLPPKAACQGLTGPSVRLCGRTLHLPWRAPPASGSCCSGSKQRDPR